MRATRRLPLQPRRAGGGQHQTQLGCGDLDHPYLRYCLKGTTAFQIGEPEHVEWWRESRPATRAEVDEAIEGGMPFLIAEATGIGPDGLKQLEFGARRVMHYLPAA
jgi:hypothetical protein